MGIEEQYDVVCSGGTFGMYLTAALLASSGKRVLLVDDALESELSSREDLYFERDFMSFSGVQEGGAFHRAFEQIFAGSNLGSQFMGAEEIVQVLDPNSRVVLWNDPKEVSRELKQNLAREAEPISDFFDLIYKSYREIPRFALDARTLPQIDRKDHSMFKRFLKDFYPPIVKKRPIPLGSVMKKKGAVEGSRLASALIGGLSYSAPYNVGAEQVLRGLAQAVVPQHLFNGGVKALKELLSATIESNHGAVRRGSRVSSLLLEKRKVVGVILSSYEGVIRASNTVLGSSIKRIYFSLPPKEQDPTLLRAIRRVEPTHWRFTFSVALPHAVIPVGMASNVTYVGSYDAPLEEENLLRIRLLAKDGSMATKEDKVITMMVTALVPYRSSTLHHTYLRKLSAKIFHVLSEIVPYLEDHIIDLFPDFRKGEEEIQRCYPFSGSQWLAEELLQYYVRGHRGAQDFWGPPWNTSHDGLYFAGRMIWPALGPYGEALVAEKICADVLAKN